MRQALVILLVVAAGAWAWQSRSGLRRVSGGVRRALGFLTGERGTGAPGYELALFVFTWIRPGLVHSITTGARPPHVISAIVPTGEGQALLLERPEIEQDVRRMVRELNEEVVRGNARRADWQGTGRKVHPVDPSSIDLRIHLADVPERCVVTALSGPAADVRVQEVVRKAEATIAGIAGVDGVVVPDTPAELVQAVGTSARRPARTRAVGSPVAARGTSPMEGAVGVRLCVSTSGHQGMVWLRQGRTVVVGRDETCGLPVPEAMHWVSARHLEVRRQGRGIVVRDCSSLGTWRTVAGRLERLSPGEEYPLTPGERLALDVSGTVTVEVVGVPEAGR